MINNIRALLRFPVWLTGYSHNGLSFLFIVTGNFLLISCMIAVIKIPAFRYGYVAEWLKALPC